MTAYNFAAQFADAVESGEKTQTIRAPRKRGHAKVGDKLQLYTGMRTKACRKLRDAACVDVRQIRIMRNSVRMKTLIDDFQWLDAFARVDGFDSWQHMRDWFDDKYGLPFSGVLISWG